MIDAFVTRLREKAASCDYGELRDQLIRDRLVLGIADESARRRMLREKDLTLASAVELGCAAEIIDCKLKEMALDSPRPGNSINAAEGQRQGRRPTSRSSELINRPAQIMKGADECKYCGAYHKRGRDWCPAFGKSCRLCGTANHFAKVCRKKGQDARQLNAVDAPAAEDQDNEDGEQRHIYTAERIGAVNTQGGKWFVNLQLHRGRQRCLLDTGATCNVMSIRDKMTLAPRVMLQPSRTKLKL